MLVKKGDKEIVRKLYQENANKLYYIAWRILKNEEESEEAVRNCVRELIHIFSKYPHHTYDELKEMSRVLVAKAAVDIALKKASDKPVTPKPEEELEDVPLIKPRFHELIVENNEEQIKNALKKLKADEKGFIYLRYGLGMDEKEIGELLNLSTALVKVKIGKCKIRFEEILEEDDVKL